MKLVFSKKQKFFSEIVNIYEFKPLNAFIAVIGFALVGTFLLSNSFAAGTGRFYVHVYNTTSGTSNLAGVSVTLKGITQGSICSNMSGQTNTDGVILFDNCASSGTYTVASVQKTSYFIASNSPDQPNGVNYQIPDGGFNGAVFYMKTNNPAPAPTPSPSPSPSPTPTPSPSTSPPPASGSTRTNSPPPASTSVKTNPSLTTSTDTTPPTAVKNLNANYDGTVIGLSWSSSSDNVGLSGYNIERSDDQNTWNSIVKSLNETTYEDFGIVKDKHYYYRVFAADKAGNQSQPSITDVKTVLSDKSGVGSENGLNSSSSKKSSILPVAGVILLLISAALLLRLVWHVKAKVAGRPRKIKEPKPPKPEKVRPLERPKVDYAPNMSKSLKELVLEDIRNKRTRGN